MTTTLFSETETGYQVYCNACRAVFPHTAACDHREEHWIVPPGIDYGFANITVHAFGDVMQVFPVYRVGALAIIHDGPYQFKPYPALHRARYYVVHVPHQRILHKETITENLSGLRKFVLTLSGMADWDTTEIILAHRIAFQECLPLLDAEVPA